MNDGAVHNYTTRPILLTSRASDKAPLHQSQNLKLFQPPNSVSIFNRILRPLAHIHIPQRRIIRRNGRNTSQHIQRGSIASQRTVETLSRRVGGFHGTVLDPSKVNISVGVAIRDRKQALSRGKQRIVSAHYNTPKGRRKGGLLHGRCLLHVWVGGDVEYRAGEGEARDEAHGDGANEGFFVYAYTDHTVMEVGEGFRVIFFDAVAVLIENLGTDGAGYDGCIVGVLAGVLDCNKWGVVLVAWGGGEWGMSEMSWA